MFARIPCPWIRTKHQNNIWNYTKNVFTDNKLIKYINKLNRAQSSDLASIEFGSTCVVVHTSRHSLLLVHLQQPANAKAFVAYSAQTARVLLHEASASTVWLLGRTAFPNEHKLEKVGINGILYRGKYDRKNDRRSLFFWLWLAINILIKILILLLRFNSFQYKKRSYSNFYMYVSVIILLLNVIKPYQRVY